MSLYPKGLKNDGDEPLVPDVLPSESIPATEIRPTVRGSLRMVSFCPVPNGIYAGMLAMNRAFVAAGLPEYRLQRFRAVEAFARATGRYRLNRRLARLPGRACITLLGWPNDGRAFPYNWVLETIPWICDCWPPDYDKWEDLFSRNRIRLAFISSQGSAEYFRKRIPGMECVWMPECCDPAEYMPEKPLARREIQVLELGRKSAPYHSAIAPVLARRGVRHHFATDGSRTQLFIGQEALYRGLGDTAVSICFPKTVTHPEAAGGLESVTLRYLEAIASKCLLVGRSPAELDELLGFSAVIEVDDARPGEQLLGILDELPNHQPLVDRAYERLLEVGTAQVRVRSMLNELRARGWVVPGAG